VAEIIEIVAYDPTWPAQFCAERDRIKDVLGDFAVRIEHHGSTSVPGGAAKPVIDIQVSVRSLQPMEAYRSRLAELGYVHVPHVDDSFAPFFHRPQKWPHTHHAHIVQAGDPEERRTLAFRDYLREHSDVARAYEELKRTLAETHSAVTLASRQAYADAKGNFIARITDQALRSGLPRDF
jgi:GrpB-like predicted nucleotidyltransferase (UPF0157 family)